MKTRKLSTPSDFAAFYQDAKVAETYDLVRSSTLKRRIVRTAEKQFFLDALSGTTSVLEVGCGTGELTSVIAPGRKLTAIDLSERMLALSQTKVPNENVSFYKMNMFELDSLAGSFEAVFAARVFMHLGGSDLAEMLRLCTHKVQKRGLVVFDVQRGNLIRLLASNPANKVVNYNYAAKSLAHVIQSVPGLQLKQLVYFDHLLPLIPFAFISGRHAPQGFVNLLAQSDLLLKKLAVGAGKIGVICQRM